MKKIGIYVHIPFCKRKCNYCDFYSVKWDEETENKYIKSIINEINSYKGLNYSADTIFFGGGTPTIISPDNLMLIINEIKNTFEVDENSEISMEANPNTLTAENLTKYKEIGINRLSIGVQSLNDDVLRKIGRLHNSKEALNAIDSAIFSGFENINADVMFNIPGQTVEDIEQTIREIISHNVKHISFYSLKLEEGTPMYIMEENNKIVMPDEDDEREMYYAGRNIMKNNELLQYEISNFANEGYKCRHNLKYWNQEEYIGFGPSAHSFLNRKRFSNISDLKMYCYGALNNNFNRQIHELLDDEGLIFEYIMLRLRLNEGLSIKIFKDKFNIDFIIRYKEQLDYLTENKLIECINQNDNTIIKLTEKGMDISNFVFGKFLR